MAELTCSSPQSLFKSGKFWSSIAGQSVAYDYNLPDFTPEELSDFMSKYTALFSNPGMSSPHVWVYLPFDPNTGKKPGLVNVWPKKEVSAGGRRVMLSYSKNLAEYQKNPLIVPVLIVNYHQPLVWVDGWSDVPPELAGVFTSLGFPSMPFYTGLTDIARPPGELPLAWQAKLWKAGAMVSREYIPTVHEEDREIFDQLSRVLQSNGLPPLCSGWYYIAYSARYLDIPLPDPGADKVVVTYYFGAPAEYGWPGIGGVVRWATQGEIIDHINSIAGFIEQVYESAGWKVGDYSYTGDDGQEHRGISVYFVEKDGRAPAYALSIPLERAQLSLGPELGVLIVIAVVAVAITATMEGYFWYEVRMRELGLEKEKTEATKQIPDDWQKIYRTCVSNGGDPNKCSRYATEVVTGMASVYRLPSSGGGTEDITKWAVLGIGAIAVAYALSRRGLK